MNVIQLVALLSADMVDEERLRTEAIYHSALHSLISFRDVRSAPLEAIFNSGFLADYQRYLLARGCMRNTVSFYMRALRAIFNKAVKRGLIAPVDHLFEHVFTGNDPTEKRALSPGVLFRILEADFSGNPLLERTRDLFALTFFLHGMPFVDLMHLRKQDVRGDTIVYRRSKTNGVVVVPLDDKARRLIDKYADSSSTSSYLFPFITGEGREAERQYNNILHAQNRNLKSVAAALHITDRLTTYVSRHTWATIAYHAGVEVPVISQALGHHDQNVTQVYLAAFKPEALRQAGQVVLQAVYGYAKKALTPCKKARRPSPVKRRTP